MSIFKWISIVVFVQIYICIDGKLGASCKGQTIITFKRLAIHNTGENIIIIYMYKYAFLNVWTHLSNANYLFCILLYKR